VRRRKHILSANNLENLKNDFFKKGGTVTRIEDPVPIEHSVRQKFYKSEEWKVLRDDFILKHDTGKCINCGVIWGTMDESKINVDHIHPIKFNWERRLDPTNLQLLCEACNRYKGNKIKESAGRAMYYAMALREDQLKEQATASVFEEALALWELTKKQLNKIAHEFTVNMVDHKFNNRIEYYRYQVLRDEAIKIAKYKSIKE